MLEYYNVVSFFIFPTVRSPADGDRAESVAEPDGEGFLPDTVRYEIRSGEEVEKNVPEERARDPVTCRLTVFPRTL